MGVNRYSGVRLAGLASAVPAHAMNASETGRMAGLDEEEARKIAESVGVQRRRVAQPGLCTSDMCRAAAERLLPDLGWDRASIDALIFVSQTPDYPLPATACVLHDWLGLSKNCAALDVNLGCSGYLYGLWLASNLIAAGSARRVLLLVGETASWGTSPLDRSGVFLFGDAGTATAIEADPNAPPICFAMGTDGTGHKHLLIPAGASRNPATVETLQRVECADGIWRTGHEGRMNGAEVFAFTLREVPGLFKKVLEAAGWSVEAMDAFVPHQANLFMLEHLRKRMKIPVEKQILALDEFGNTSSASVPLALTTRLRDQLSAGAKNLVLAGFGVGWSWGAAAVTAGPLCMPELVEVAEPHAP